MNYTYGTPYESRVSFRNKEGVVGNPATVTLLIISPDEQVEVRTYPTGITAARTVYSAEILLNQPGEWYIRWEGTGDYAGVFESTSDEEDPLNSIVVNPSRFYP